jgi:hypothetical protein
VELVTVGVGHLRIPLTPTLSPQPARLRATATRYADEGARPSRGTICVSIRAERAFWRMRITSGCPLDALGRRKPFPYGQERPAAPGILLEITTL